MNSKSTASAFFIISLFCTNGLAQNCGSQQQFNCMVAAINGEARGESYKGMLVVGKALKTRQLRGYLGKSICGIAKKSFAPKSLTRTGTKGKTKSKIIKAAKAACASRDAGYTHFHSLGRKYATRWSRSFTFKGRVGRHYLFNAPRGTRSHFNGFSSQKNIDNQNFLTEDDKYYYKYNSHDIFKFYTDEDDHDTRLLLLKAIDESIEI